MPTRRHAGRLAPRISVACGLALLGMGPAAADTFDPLVAGVSQVVSPGAPGPLFGTDPAWRTIVSGDEDASLLSAFILAREFGAGRVVAFGHDGFPLRPDLLDNGQLIRNVFDWLRNGGSGAVRYTTGHGEWLTANLSALAAHLASSGYTLSPLAAPVSAAAGGARILIVGNAWQPFSAAEITALQGFVNNGGGLLLFGLGWSWPTANGPYPMSTLAQPFEVHWLRTVISDPTDQLNGSPVLSRFYPEARAGDFSGATGDIVQAYSDHPDDLDDALEVDVALRERFITAHLVLAQVPIILPENNPVRQDLYDFSRGLLDGEGAAGTTPRQYLRKPRRYDPTTHRAMAWMRERFYVTWKNALPLTAERAAEIAARGEFTPAHAGLLTDHGIYLQDNSLATTAQLRVLDTMLDLVPRELHDLGSISIRDYLGGGPPAPATDTEFFATTRGAVNIFSFEVGEVFENSFPDVEVPRAFVDTFSIALAHEINHVVDAFTMTGKPSLAARKAQLLARAGDDPLDYLRSGFEPGFFVDAPQEFIASISNQWFQHSASVLHLGRSRFDAGRPEPLNQFLFFAELYSRGGDSTLFYTDDVSGRLTRQSVPLTRDANGHIDGLRWAGRIFRFTRDAQGNVLDHDVLVDPTAPAYLVSPAFKDFRFRVELWGTAGPFLGVAGPCVAQALCVAGATPGVTEVLARIDPPRPNGHRWPLVARFATGRVDVAIEQVSTGRRREYSLPAVLPGDSVLPGILDPFGFPSARNAGLEDRAPDGADAWIGGEVDPAPPAGAWLTVPTIPGYRFKARLIDTKKAREGKKSATCLPATLCVYGASAKRTDLLLRLSGPQPGGTLRPAVIKLATDAAQVWVEQTKSKRIRYYFLRYDGESSWYLDGAIDPAGFRP